MGIVDFLFSTRHLIVVCTQTCIFRCCIVFEAVVCRLYEMLYPCICNVMISRWKSGAYGIVICRGGTDMCFVPGSGWKHLDLEQYRISGLTRVAWVCVQVCISCAADTYLSSLGSCWRQTLVSSPRENCCCTTSQPYTWGNQRRARSQQRFAR